MARAHATPDDRYDITLTRTPGSPTFTMTAVPRPAEVRWVSCGSFARLPEDGGTPPATEAQDQEGDR